MLPKIKLLIISLFIFSISDISAQELLKFKITISENNYKTGEILKIIEQSAGIKFSYNSELINTEKSIHFSSDNKQLEDCLDEIFENKIRYNVSGKHIILLKKSLPEEKNQDKQKISIFGTVINAENNEVLANVSIYDFDNQYSTISNYQGEFNFTINSNEEFRGLSLGKRGFYDTVIIVNLSENSMMNISLRPKEAPVEAIKPIEDAEISIENVKTTGMFIPKSTIINSQNLDFIDDTKPFQISLLPGLSSNLSNFGVVKNNVSLNILIGYSRGVKGIETAGLMNFNKENVSGVQIAGLTNTVGGKVTGFQASGIMNVVLKDVEACQLTGIGNIVHGNMKGVQTGGIFNTTVGNFNGVQVGGIINLTTKHFDGVQTAGIININANSFKGVQLAGIVNFNYGKIKGAQVSGLINFATDTLSGAQFSGALNIAEYNTFQLSGLLNIAKNNSGFQLAPFNLCDTSSGVSVGVISFVRKGLHKFVISSDEIYFTNLSFQTGNDKFYNIFSVSYRPDKKIIWGYGYGFGHKFHLSKSVNCNLEIVTKNISYNKVYNPEVYNYYRLSTVFEFRIKQKLSFYAGPSVNFYHGDITVNTETNDFISNLNYIPVKQKITEQKVSLAWIGFSVGFSL